MSERSYKRPCGERFASGRICKREGRLGRLECACRGRLPYRGAGIIGALKLIVAVVHNSDRNRVVEDLVRQGYKFTIIGSTGGFLREGNTTFLIGVDNEEKESVLSLIQQNCKTREQMVNVLPPDASPVGTFVPNPIKVPVGGAIAFVLDVDQFERF